jgi:FdhE protein
VGDVSGQRYLACSLCSAQWHRPRIQCARCGTEKVHYQSLQAVDDAAADGLREGALQAECCDACGHYLKIVHMEKDPHVEPAADDLASLTLDILVGEAGMNRHGVNLMLLFAEPETPDDGGGP